jgi:hypothetical protein
MSEAFSLIVLDVLLSQLFLTELLSVTANLAEEDEDEGKDEADSFCKQLDSSRFVRRMSISPSSLGIPFFFCLSIVINKCVDL